MIKTAILFTNEMVAAFDNKGKQIPECQGKHSEVVDKILSNSNEDTGFFFGIWGEQPFKIEVTKEQWHLNKWGVYPVKK